MYRGRGLVEIDQSQSDPKDITRWCIDCEYGHTPMDEMPCRICFEASDGPEGRERPLWELKQEAVDDPNRQ